MPTVYLMKEQKKQAMAAVLSYMAKRNAASPEMMESLWQKQRSINHKDICGEATGGKELWTLE